MTTQGPSVTHAVKPVVGEHDQLRRLLAQVEAAFGRPAPRAGSGPDVIAVRLDMLRGPLRAHFDELGHGYGVALGRVRKPAPEWASASAQLRADQEQLIQKLDSLRSAPPVERRGAVWPRDVRRFLQDLTEYQARESALVAALES